MRQFFAILFSIFIFSFVETSARADIADGACTDVQKSNISSDHTVTLNGHSYDYTATVGFLEVTAADQKSKACVFYTSYVVHADPTANRPLTFAFNGGPGSASLWLHLGLMGPKRVDMGPDGLTPPAAPTLIDNESSPLDVTDIVMIDPVATGFSHTEGTSSNSAFFGVKNDYKSIAVFVQDYLNTNNRWNSPKYILGESYGGIRGPLLTRHLQEMGIGITGVILVSPVLSFTSVDFVNPDNTVPYWTYFPNYATTAWFHQRLNKSYQSMDVETVYQNAKQFAAGPLRDALDSGSELEKGLFDAMAQSISDFTGVAKDLAQNLNLRISDMDFFTNLLKDQKMSVGRFDGRFKGLNLSQNPNEWVDPSSNALGFPFTASINDYLRVTLKFPSTSPYTTSADINEWPSDSDGTEYGVLPDLSQALADNPSLKVLIASGYFDLACPMATVDFELSQLPGGLAIRSRVSHTKYFGGHMMYINPDALKQLKTDISTFITQPNVTVGEGI